MNPSQKHYIEEIRQSPGDLDDTSRAHIRSCKRCRAEYNAHVAIERSVATQPVRQVPSSLKALIFARIMAPAYRLWHIMVALLLTILSPVVISYRLDFMQSAGLSTVGSALLFGVYGILLTSVLVTLAFMIFGRYHNRLEDFKHRVDDLIESRLK